MLGASHVRSEGNSFKITSYREAVQCQKLLIVAAWMVLAFNAYASISSIQDRPTLPTSFGFDGVDHLAAFAVLGALFYLAYPRQIVFVCLVVLGSAVLLVFAQLLTADRHARFWGRSRK
jgi:hypothetical protein